MSPRTQTAVAVALLAGGILAAYHGIYASPFVYLDQSAIRDNPGIRHLWPIWEALRPSREPGITVEGRPLLNLTLAINYALSGARVGSYHAVNVLIHLLAALTLFGIVRRTVKGPGATAMALSVALLWGLHPLQTESVTYTIQRAESLMGLFYLLTLYCFIRAVSSRPRKGVESDAGPTALRPRLRGVAVWAGLSILCCLCGMATKEVMVSAPVIVFLYDRTFISGSFRAAWARGWRYYLCLAATWIPLAGFVLSTGGNRGGTSGFGLGVSFGGYLLTQFPALIHYLRLAVWPHPLVFFYETRWFNAAQAAPAAAAVVGLAVASLIGLARGSPWGFLGVFFFAILAPTSLIPGMSQTQAEHRMYLALAPVMVALVFGLRRVSAAGSPRVLFYGLVALLAVAFGYGTIRRNEVYRSEVALWSDTVAKAPANPFSQNNLGIALVSAGRTPEAMVHFNRALQLKPDYAEADDNLGLALAESGRIAEAVGRYQASLRLRPDSPATLANLGAALANLGRMDEAAAVLRRAVALAPGYAAAHNDLAVVLARTGRMAPAMVEYREALRLAPQDAETHYNLANALAESDQWAEAAAQYEWAVRLRPGYADALANLGVALAKTGRLPEAVTRYEEALRLTPNDPTVHYNLALALRDLGRSTEAEAHFAIARRRQSGR